MSWWQRKRDVIRVLMPGEEAFEGTYLGRWDGHYHLVDAVWITLTSQGTDKRRLDGRTSVQETKALGYQVVGEVRY